MVLQACLSDAAKAFFSYTEHIMLLLSKELYGRDILSLRTGSAVALAEKPIIDPSNLKIIGWWCKSFSARDSKILLSEDVRELLPGGLAVNDEIELSEPDELVRHRDVIDLKFTLEGKQVKTKNRKLGKVSDYSFNEGYFVQKLYVEQPLVKALSNDTLIIDRRQIIEITDRYIMVKDTEIKSRSRLPLPKLVSKLLPTTPAQSSSSSTREINP